MSALAPVIRIGESVMSIDTPALLVDLDLLQRNIAAMAGFAHSNGIRLRPHSKTHKCIAIAQMQIAAGAIGICCQKVSEAEAFVLGGITDILLSNEVISPPKLRRLMALTDRARIGICIDSALGLDRLAEAARDVDRPVDVYVELDVGAGRCGVKSPAEALALIEESGACRGLRYAGVQAYQGKAQHFRTPEERQRAIDVACRLIGDLRDLLAQRSIAIGTVTGAGTGTFYAETGSGIYDEIQPGSYIFMDRDYRDNSCLPDAITFGHSLTLLTEVMSASSAHVVVDAGLKAHAVDSGMPVVLGRSDLTYGNPSDEHGVVRCANGDSLPALGEKLSLVPGHCDPTVNLHDWLVIHRDGYVVDLWRIEARGALS